MMYSMKFFKIFFFDGFRWFLRYQNCQFATVLTILKFFFGCNIFLSKNAGTLVDGWLNYNIDHPYFIWLSMNETSSFDKLKMIVINYVSLSIKATCAFMFLRFWRKLTEFNTDLFLIPIYFFKCRFTLPLRQFSIYVNGYW